MTLLQLVDTNRNIGNGKIKIFNKEDGHCSFKGNFSNISDYVKNLKVMDWTFVIEKQINVIEYDFCLYVTL